MLCWRLMPGLGSFVFLVRVTGLSACMRDHTCFIILPRDLMIYGRALRTSLALVTANGAFFLMSSPNIRNSLTWLTHCHP